MILRTIAALAGVFFAFEAHGASVLEYHNNGKRDGQYADAAITTQSVRSLHRVTTFDGAYKGAVYAQPLYVENGPAGKPAVYVSTEENEVLAFDAKDGRKIWSKKLGPAMPSDNLPCGNIDPLGITGTPVIDLASRTLFVDGMVADAGNRTSRHKVFALSLDDGAIRSGWPVDMQTVRSGNIQFDSMVQNERGALALVDGNVYVPFGGHFGDCGEYHGWVVGIPVSNPSQPFAWASRAVSGAGIWAPGGVANDGKSVYVATGNSFEADTYSDGEAIIKLGRDQAGSFGVQSFWAPSNWKQLDDGDIDIGGSGPLLLDVPGARPERLAMALGKDGNAYLLDRDKLGGIGAELKQMHVSTGAIIQGAAAFNTADAAYVVFRGRGVGCASNKMGLTALKVAKGAPPTMSIAWCANLSGRGSPALSVDPSGKIVVWVIGAEGDNLLHGFDGLTGEEIYNGRNSTMGQVRRFQTPIVVGGRIYVAGDDRLYAFEP